MTIKEIIFCRFPGEDWKWNDWKILFKYDDKKQLYNLDGSLFGKLSADNIKNILERDE
jgi:hypothetical protein